MCLDLVTDLYVGRSDGSAPVAVGCPDRGVTVDREGPARSGAAGDRELVTVDRRDQALDFIFPEAVVIAVELERVGPAAIWVEVRLDPVADLEVGEREAAVAVPVHTLEVGV